MGKQGKMLWLLIGRHIKSPTQLYSFPVFKSYFMSFHRLKMVISDLGAFFLIKINMATYGHVKAFCMVYCRLSGKTTYSEYMMGNEAHCRQWIVNIG